MTRVATHLAAVLTLAVLTTGARACPAALAPDGTGVRAGCPVPVDAGCWTLDAAALLHGRLARGAEAERQLAAVLAADRAECDAELDVVIAELRAAADALGTASTRADECAVDLAALTAALTAALAAPTRAHASPVLPGWAWAVAGVAAPIVGLGVCAVADCDSAGRWGAAAGGAALAVGTAVLVEW